jgi:signal transduction histidine kinase
LTRPDGTPAGAVLISRDETERLRIEEELQKAVGAREDFLSIAAHELRTPLTTLRLQAESLLFLAEGGKSVAPEKYVEKAKAVDRQAARLERLIEGLLDVSRLLAGRLDLRPEPLDLVQLATDAVQRLGRDGAVASPITVRSRGPVEGRWDRMRLEQVITNLLTNAIRYGQGRPIEVALDSVGGRALLSVRDQGMGIPLEDQKRIFGRFERAHPRGSSGGLGLGLWIVRQIVEMMGGSIFVQSEPGAGSTFTVNLPKVAPPGGRMA